MFVGGILVGLWAGALVDRINRKKILISSDLARAVLVALLPTLIQNNVWYAFADLAIISVATAFFRPAMFAAIPQVVGHDDLLPANSFFSAMDTGTEIIGPIMAGMILYTSSVRYAFLLYIDALTYVISAFCVWRMVLSMPGRSVELRHERPTIWGDAKQGLRYIRGDSLQWGLFILIFPAVLMSSGLNALQTPLAKGVVGITDTEFGTFNSVWGIGFVTASLLLGWYGGKVWKSWLILGGYFLSFAFAAMMGLSTTLRGLLLTGFAIGFANTFSYVGVITLLMEYTPETMLGRVISTRQTAISSVRIVSPIVLGVLADRSGVRQAILAMSALSILGSLFVLIRYPILWTFDKAKGITKQTFVSIGQAISGPLDPAFDIAQQRRLNIAVLGMVLVGWAGLLYRAPRQNLWLLTVLCGIAVLGILARNRGWLPVGRV
jgi:MFS family permease